MRARRPTGDEDLDADDREDFWYHYKSPGLLEANPLGMVPTLVDEDGRVVTESAVCVQFVDELARVRGCVEINQCVGCRPGSVER